MEFAFLASRMLSIIVPMTNAMSMSVKKSPGVLSRTSAIIVLYIYQIFFTTAA